MQADSIMSDGRFRASSCPAIIPCRSAVTVFYPSPILPIVQIEHNSVINPAVHPGIECGIEVILSWGNRRTLSVFLAISFKSGFLFMPLFKVCIKRACNAKSRINSRPAEHGRYII